MSRRPNPSDRRSLCKRLVDIELMERASLLELWEAEMQCPPPKAASRSFLRRALAYEHQTWASVGLPKAAEKALLMALPSCGATDDGAAAASSDPAVSVTPTRRKIALVPGSRLVREWNGTTYTVSVIEEGFVYRDKTWSSLSAIAREITGARWSGPRFFGLNQASS